MRFKKYQSLFILTLLVFSLLVFRSSALHAATTGEGGGDAIDLLRDVGEKTQGTLPGSGGTAGEETLVPAIIGNLINFFLGFLGIVALILIIYGGFLWMTARGDTEQVKKARDLLVQAVIGLVIILSSYALAGYIISRIGQTVSGV